MSFDQDPHAAADRAAPAPAPMDIICLGVSNWGLVKSNPDYTILELMKRGHRVLLVEPFETVSSFVRMAAIQRRIVSSDWGLRQEGERLWVYRPPPLAVPAQSRTPVAGRLSGRLLARLVKRAAGKLGFDPRIVWSFMYNSGTFLDAFPDALTIYENGDDDAALARNAAQLRTVHTLDKEVCEAADLIFAVTEELCAPRRVHNPQTFEVNCGVDVDFFAPAHAPETEVPKAIADLPGPVLGYFGGLDPWKMDVELITGIAKARPDWSIAMVGYVWFNFDAAPLRALPNIHVLGPQPYDQLPNFLKGMDVGLMPFPINDITRNGDALKCYEYMAAGLPVVGRAVPVARRLSDLVEIADTVDEFVAACARQMDKGPENAAALRDAMHAHDWSRRVDQKLGIIAEALS